MIRRCITASLLAAIPTGLVLASIWTAGMATSVALFTTACTLFFYLIFELYLWT